MPRAQGRARWCVSRCAMLTRIRPPWHTHPHPASTSSCLDSPLPPVYAPRPVPRSPRPAPRTHTAATISSATANPNRKGRSGVSACHAMRRRMGSKRVAIGRCGLHVALLRHCIALRLKRATAWQERSRSWPPCLKAHRGAPSSDLPAALEQFRGMHWRPRSQSELGGSRKSCKLVHPLSSCTL